MHALRRLMDAATEAESPSALAAGLLREARAFFRADRAVMLGIAEPVGNVYVSATDPVGGSRPDILKLADLAPVAELLRTSDGALQLDGPAASELAASIGVGPEVRSMLLLPIRSPELMTHLIALAHAREQSLGQRELDEAGAFAAAASACLARHRVARASATTTARHVALSRAAKSLNASLDLNRVLVRICEESGRILEADAAVVYLGERGGGLQVQAAYGLGPEAIGLRLEPGQGLAGLVAEDDEPRLMNDYQSLGPPAIYRDVHGAMAVPMHWDGDLHGVLSLGWRRPSLLRRKDLDLLTAFGEIAAAACGNASAHEGLALAARTDALTGCLNRAALHDTLHRELERCRRSGQSLSLAIVDLDDFKQVNERHGHLAGDEVLRRVGRGLRSAVRPYDIVGRYGGDEFAIVSVDADESAAREVVARAIQCISRSTSDLEFSQDGAGATGGVAEWRPGESATDLIQRADRALLYSKHEGVRGTALGATHVPDEFRPNGLVQARRFRAGAGGLQPALSESR